MNSHRNLYTVSDICTNAAIPLRIPFSMCQLHDTTSIPRLKVFKKKIQTKSSLTKLLEESINKYDILWIPHENIFHNLSNDFNFVFYILIFFDKKLVKLDIV
jgi:hypothetical protein